MIGVFLSFLGSFFEEISVSLEKTVMAKRIQTMATFGFFNALAGMLMYLFIGLVIRDSFVLSVASLPTLVPRLILDIAQAYVTLLAVARADRSAFGFIRTLTIPLLLLIDLGLGYALSNLQLLGMVIIFFSLAFLTINHGFRRKGIGYVLFSAINAAIVISLYKYNITHFNSVEAEQAVALLVLVVFFYLLARHLGERPLTALRQPRVIGVMLTQGLGSTIEGFAYLFGPASLMLAVKRASGVFWSVVSGNAYFHEKHIVVKAISLAGAVTGFAFLLHG